MPLTDNVPALLCIILQLTLCNTLVAKYCTQIPIVILTCLTPFKDSNTTASCKVTSHRYYTAILVRVYIVIINFSAHKLLLRENKH